MGLKNFKADVATAHDQAVSGTLSGISSVKMGDSDGEVIIVFHHDDLPSPLRIQAIIEGDVRDYPDATTFMFFTDTENPPQVIIDLLEGLGDSIVACSILDVAKFLAKSLGKALGGSQDQPSDVDEDEQMPDFADENDKDFDSDDYEEYYDNDVFGLGSSKRSVLHTELSPEHQVLLKRIKRDLRRVRQAGYRISMLDAMGKQSVQGIISISIRIRKLGLSEEAVEAWDLKHDEYFVLLIRFYGRYRPLEQVLQTSASDYPVSFAIGKCDKYKPSLNSALAAFVEPNSPIEVDKPEPSVTASVEFQKIFVSNSLDQFMNETFLSLLKLRESNSVSWDAANDILISKTGLIHPQSPGDSKAASEAAPPQESHASNDLPQLGVLDYDHLKDTMPEHGRSLPLVAMEFALRYFVKCTEFCLRCHRKLPREFEALRPYVCDNPLCLFQYMAMGFGPSTEHEILTEPYVVDLLVSLCYASIQPFYANRAIPSTSVPQAPVSRVPIRTFPAGLHLQVPGLAEVEPSKVPIKVQITTTQDTAHLKLVHSEDVFSDRLMPGSWIAFRVSNAPTILAPVTHAVILQADSLLRTVDVSIMGSSAVAWNGNSTVGPAFASTFTSHDPPQSTAPVSNPSDESYLGELFLYDVDFDSLSDDGKASAMRHVLDTLPSILSIEEYLAAHPHKSLRTMVGISPAAASLLQWIVSSNRSCIFQVDRSRSLAAEMPRDQNPIPPPQTRLKDGTSLGPTESSHEDDRPAGRGRDRAEERLPGMEGWVQFKFAQGSPDKELRFQRALQQVAARKKLTEHPTIFAWHGSALPNWHSIVRTGLDYTDIRSGRAYGNGVYFSPHMTTSLGYSGGCSAAWPNSGLRFTNCMSLNEIINAPNEFVSTSPHYVVSHNDWHQCRYLLVQTDRSSPYLRNPSTRKALSEPMTPSTSSEGRLYHKQATGWEIKDAAGKALKIPLASIPMRSIDSGSRRPGSSSKRPIPILDEDSEEDVEDIEDVDCLFSDEEPEVQGGHMAKKMALARSSNVEASVRIMDTARPPTPMGFATPDLPTTDFRPGTLDWSSLTRLSEPSWATDIATKALSRELRALQKIQAAAPLHELGWYIEFEGIENLYQWIVEFHSFDSDLPLAQDMKKDGVASIVMEIRFPRSFPFDPPFIRVIRPRFLPFLEGGGGHITAGGAVCMELLTTTGWSPANSMESVLLQVRVAMCSLDPRPGRLMSSRRTPTSTYGHGGDYAIGEAVDAYIRAARSHGWKVPSDLQQTANGV